MSNEERCSFIKLKNSIRNLNYIQFVKVAIGSTIAVLLAQYLDLQYATSAGIITLLTIQDTKKETLEVSIKRLIAFVIAVTLATLLFLQFGFTAVTYGVFLLLFIILSNLFALEVAIASSAVLMTHLLGEGAVNVSIILNEVYLLVIGAGIGVILNLYMPNTELRLKERQQNIDKQMKHILLHLSEEIIAIRQAEEEELFQELINELNEAMKLAKQVLNNSFNSDAAYYMNYIEMRKNQSMLLKEIHSHIHRLEGIPSQAYEISAFIQNISNSYHEYNNAERLLIDVFEIKKGFKKQALPTTREEFESRAILFQIVHEFDYFIQIKNNFAHSLTQGQIHRTQ